MTNAEHGTPLLTAAEMRAWDARAIEEMGIPGRVLMEAAGRAVAEVVARRFPRGVVAGLIGRGNNGGDAVVALRTLAARGREVVAIPIRGAEVTPDLTHGWAIPVASDPLRALAGASVIIDGLLGTGASGAPRDEIGAMIELANSAGAPIVSLDGPSGVDMTTAAVAGAAIRATVTVTFGAPKRGLWLHPGKEHAGRIIIAEIGLPPLDACDARLITREWAKHHLPRVPANAHKGTLGQLLVIAGAGGMGGAAIMTAMGALRAGAGTVRVASEPRNRAAINIAVPEALFVDLEDWTGWQPGSGSPANRAPDPGAAGREGGEQGRRAHARGVAGVGDEARAGRSADAEDGDVASADEESSLRESLRRCDALVVGPGMGASERTRAVVEAALGAGAPIVLDADALNVIARTPDILDGGLRRVVMTPHPGEAARLLGDRDAHEIARDPIDSARRLAERFSATVLLKGAPSVVASPHAPTLVATTGHPGVATGGMGDTLAGIIGAFLAAGAEPREAAGLAIHYAGAAADHAGRGRALLPRDVAEALSEVMG